MGCSVSKMEDEGEASAGLGRPIRHRIEEIWTRRMLHGRRVGKDSFVSTTELLRREEEDDATTVTTVEEVSRECSLQCDGICSACGAHFSSLPRESTSSTTPPTVAVLPPLAEVTEARTEEVKAVVACNGRAGGSEGGEKSKKHEVEGDDEAETVTKEVDGRDERERGEEQGKEENGREKKQKDEMGGGAASLSGGRRRLGYDEAEMPGSPSFRVYFVESLVDFGDDDSADSVASDAGKRDQNELKGGVRSTTSEDAGEGKSTRRHRRGRRLKGLRRGPNAMYGLLNVRSCYSHRGNGAHPTQTPALLAEKVA